MILQHHTPEDFVLATGEAHKVLRARGNRSTASEDLRIICVSCYV
jgi:GDP-D-mannose dehydratase